MLYKLLSAVPPPLVVSSTPSLFLPRDQILPCTTHAVATWSWAAPPPHNSSRARGAYHVSTYRWPFGTLSGDHLTPCVSGMIIQ